MENCNHGPDSIEIEDLDTFDWCSYCDHSELRYHHRCCNSVDCDYFRCMIADIGGGLPQNFKC